MDVALRVSDAERRAVVEELATHYADGRLTMDELQARTAEAWGARTDAELAVVLGDLPVPVRHAHLSGRVPLPGVGVHAVVAAAGVTTAWAVEATGPTPGDQWPLALALVWGAGLAVHGAGAWLRRQVAAG